MTKNVLIFCDGTGQVGGLRLHDVPSDALWPGSAIDPAKRVAFYDPGIGSSVDGGGLVGTVVRRVYNLIAQATGFGITRNVVLPTSLVPLIGRRRYFHNLQDMELALAQPDASHRSEQR